MKRLLIEVDIKDIPFQFHGVVKDARIYDSSCSPDARVYFIDKDNGYYLKRAQKGSLKEEAILTEYYCKKGLAPTVAGYLSGEKDWLLTARMGGEDCTFPTYLSDPKRLCDIIAKRLRELHELDSSDCPIEHTAKYLAAVERNRERGVFDGSYSTIKTADQAWRIVTEKRGQLKTDTLLHGDYCLPNIILDDWKFSGFVDLGNGGVGDRHVDLFWGVWTLKFNLKTDEYRDRFLDAYGRDKIDEDMLYLISAAECFG